MPDAPPSRSHGRHTGSAPALGYALALFSAGCSDVLITTIARQSKVDPAPQTTNTWMLLGTGFVLSPLLFCFLLHAHDATSVCAAGALLSAPASIGLFFALSRLSPVAVGAIGLSEAVVTAASSRLAFHAPFVPLQAAAMGFILAAATLEITSRPRLIPSPASAHTPVVAHRDAA